MLSVIINKTLPSFLPSFLPCVTKCPVISDRVLLNNLLTWNDMLVFLEACVECNNK